MKFLIPFILVLAPMVTWAQSEIPVLDHVIWTEVYECDELVYVVWLKADQAGAMRVERIMSNPRLRQAAMQARAEARENGHAYRVDNDRACPDL